MKIIAIITAIAAITTLTGLSAYARADDDSYLPNEYVGYAEYKSIDKNGNQVTVKTPVRYKKPTNRDYAENDFNNAVRDCRIELERAKQENDEYKQRVQFSAKYMPLYYFQ